MKKIINSFKNFFKKKRLITNYPKFLQEKANNFKNLISK